MDKNTRNNSELKNIFNKDKTNDIGKYLLFNILYKNGKEKEYKLKFITKNKELSKKDQLEGINKIVNKFKNKSFNLIKNNKDACLQIYDEYTQQDYYIRFTDISAIGFKELSN